MFLLGGYETFIHLLWTNKSSPTSLPIPDVDSCPVNQISSVKNAVKTSQIAIHGHRWASQTLFVKCIRDLQDLYLLMIPTNCGWKTFNILTGNMETFLNFDHLIAIQTRKDDAIPPSIPSCNPHKLQSTHGIPATWRRASVTYAVAMVAVWVTSPTLHGRIPFSTPLLPPPTKKKHVCFGRLRTQTTSHCWRSNWKDVALQFGKFNLCRGRGQATLKRKSFYFEWNFCIGYINPILMVFMTIHYHIDQWEFSIMAEQITTISYNFGLPDAQ